MSFRALFTADVHCHNSLPYAVRDPETLISDRLQDTLSVLDQMGTYAREHDIPDIFILGDLLDKRLVDAVTLKMVAAKLSGLNEERRVRLVPGNHEAYDGQARHFALDVFREMDIWVASPGPDGDVGFQVKSADLQFVALPYGPTDRALEVIRMIGQGSDPQHTILLLHHSLKGGRVGEWVCPEGIDQEILHPFAAVLAGHFHTSQNLYDDVYYLGAPLQHNFGDRGEERGFWDVTFDGGAMTKMELVPVTAPRFHELEFASCAPEFESPGPDYFRVRVVASESDMKLRMRQATELCHELKRAGARYANPVPHALKEPAKNRLKVGPELGWSAVVHSWMTACSVHTMERPRLEDLGLSLIAEADR